MQSVKKGEWSRVPTCSWKVTDSEGNARCAYRSLKDYTSALTMAQYTIFDQRYVDDAIERVKENLRDSVTDPCSPESCPRWLARLAYGVKDHPLPTP
jgi:hypothetical protein